MANHNGSAADMEEVTVFPYIPQNTRLTRKGRVFEFKKSGVLSLNYYLFLSVYSEYSVVQILSPSPASSDS